MTSSENICRLKKKEIAIQDKANTDFSDAGLTYVIKWLEGQKYFSVSYQIHSTFLSDWHEQKGKYHSLKCVLWLLLF